MAFPKQIKSGEKPKKLLIESGARISGKIGVYEMPRKRSYEIDEIEDLEELNKFFNYK